MPDVSIIMPVYNAGEFIAESIKSVIAQTYTNWELIIVDDGSTDNTAKIVWQYQSTDSRICYIYQQNGRQGKARNNGIKNSRGRYLAFLDADDLWTDNKLQLQVNILNTKFEVDLVFSQGYFLMADNSVQSYDVKVQEWNVENDGDVLLDWNQIPILSVIVKKKVVEDVGLFIEEISVQNAEDYHLWLKLLYNGCCFLSLADRLFYYRIHPMQITYQSNNIYKAVTNAYCHLVEEQVLSSANQVLYYRIKWLIINYVNPTGIYNKLKPIFSGKKNALFLYILFNRIFTNNKLIKRVANRFL